MTPSTAAGRALLDNHLYWGEWYEHNWLASILAIEAEATAAERERVRARLQEIEAALPNEHFGGVYAILDAGAVNHAD